MTPTDIRNAREQLRCGGHKYVPTATVCEWLDVLLAEIEKKDEEGEESE